jgi:conjugal transfer pilus assembly protein TraE
MDLGSRVETITDLKKQIRRQQQIGVGLVVIGACLAIKLVLQSEIVLLNTPGLPANAVIARSSMDRASQRATLLAVTSNLVQVNPSNFTYQKAFLQPYFAADAYTRLSKEIDDKAKQLADAHELGSYYFVFRDYEYDPDLDRHFVVGDVHTVNAAIDSARPFVFEYRMHADNYRPVIDDAKTYPGDRPHDSAWLKQVNQK